MSPMRTRSRPHYHSRPWRRPSCCGWCTVRRCAYGDRPWTRCWWNSNRGQGGTRGPRVVVWTAWRWWWSTSFCAACRTPLLLADWDSLSDMSRTPPWTPVKRPRGNVRWCDGIIDRWRVDRRHRSLIDCCERLPGFSLSSAEEGFSLCRS